MKDMTAKERYDKENTRVVTLKLNKNTDADILNALEHSENKQGYIKSAIRKKIQSEGE